MLSRQERQIVRPALGLHGFLPEYGRFRGRLISVRSEVQIFPGPLREMEAPLEVTASGGVLAFIVGPGALAVRLLSELHE